jgi:hypothetical protein
LAGNGQLMAYVPEQGTLSLIDSSTAQEIHRLDKLGDNPSVFTFSKDGRMLAWAGWREPAVHLLEGASWKERCTFTGHRGPSSALAFAADGTILVSGGYDTTAMVWDLTGRLTAKTRRSKSLTPSELDACWTALAGEDAVAAYEAVQKCAASPVQAIAHFGKRLRPVLPADEKLTADLISELDNDQFDIREKASRQLEELGDQVISACCKALAGKPSVEARRRLEEIVHKHSRKWRTPSGDEIRTLRALEVLERVGTPEARRVLESLAKGAPEARPTMEATASLERLARRPAAP